MPLFLISTGDYSYEEPSIQSVVVIEAEMDSDDIAKAVEYVAMINKIPAAEVVVNPLGEPIVHDDGLEGRIPPDPDADPDEYYGGGGLSPDDIADQMSDNPF